MSSLFDDLDRAERELLTTPRPPAPILFLGDTQIGAGTDYGPVVWGDGSRLWDQRETLERIADLANTHALAVVHLGDVYQRRTPTSAEQVVFRTFLDRLEVPCYVLLGNHDRGAVGMPSAVDPLLGHPSLELVADTPTVADIAGVGVGFLPWAPTAAHAGAQDVPIGERSLWAAERLLDAARALRASGATVLATHYSVSGTILPAGIATGQLATAEPVLNLADLDAVGFELAVAGHIQRWQQAGRAFAYIGSPYVCDYGEAHYAHGVALYRPDEVQPLEFVELPGRPFVTLDGHATAAGDVVVGDLDGGRVNLDGAVVRVRLHVPAGARVDVPAVRRTLLELGAHRVYQVQLDTERVDRARVERHHVDRSPLAMLPVWAGAQSDTPDPAPLVERATVYLERLGA